MPDPLYTLLLLLPLLLMMMMMMMTAAVIMTLLCRMIQRLMSCRWRRHWQHISLAVVAKMFLLMKTFTGMLCSYSSHHGRVQGRRQGGVIGVSKHPLSWGLVLNCDRSTVEDALQNAQNDATSGFRTAVECTKFD